MSFQTPQKENYHFIYNGIEYDATEYAGKHPGGITFLRNMKQLTKDFTEYFRALHSDAAQKVLKSFPIVAVGKPSHSSEEYMEIYKKVEVYMKPIWTIQILLFLLIGSAWVIGCVTEYTWLSILSFAVAQIIVGWAGHSAVHSRNSKLYAFGRMESMLLGGFSADWWNEKHNMHHMFTNIKKYDQDIQHEYKVYLYEFMYLKWRFESLVRVIKDRNYIEIAYAFINYGSLIASNSFLNWVIAELLSAFYSAFILIGNHQREKTYAENPKMPFIDHQIITSRNYKEESFFWLLFMGGMQYQAQHHLFPQIPFYRLPQAKIVIHKELAKLNKSLIYGSVV